MLAKSGKEEYELTEKEEENQVTLKDKLLWFAKTPAIIVAVVLFVGEACLYLIKF